MTVTVNIGQIALAAAAAGPADLGLRLKAGATVVDGEFHAIVKGDAGGGATDPRGIGAVTFLYNKVTTTAETLTVEVERGPLAAQNVLVKNEGTAGAFGAKAVMVQVP